MNLYLKYKDIDNKMIDKPTQNYLMSLQELLARNTTEESGTFEQKLDFFIAYVSGKPMTEACRLSGIGNPTGKYWKKQDWFQLAITYTQRLAQSDLDRVLTDAIDRCANGIVDDIANGDLIKTKDGYEYRKPLTAYQKTVIFATLFDKREVIRKGVEESGASQNESMKSLEDLKKTFEEINKAVNANPDKVVSIKQD